MKKLCSCLFATALAACATPALSADLPLGVVTVEMPAAPDEPYDWTGPYAGIFAGVAWGRTAATDVGIAGAYFLDPNETIAAATTGFAVGGTVGANWQLDSLVLGIEGDLGYMGVNGTGSSATNRGATLTTGGGAFATLRARAGIAIDQLLLFGTVGLAAANLSSSLDSGIGAPFPTPATGWQTGWVAGLGAELALNETWSVKGEYLYYDLGATNVTAGTSASFDVKHTGSLVRAGLNAHF